VVWCQQGNNCRGFAVLAHRHHNAVVGPLHGRSVAKSAGNGTPENTARQMDPRTSEKGAAFAFAIVKFRIRKTYNYLIL
jgi:hypothetical protein